jgi:type II secretory pathway pseudopilin PulG
MKRSKLQEPDSKNQKRSKYFPWNFSRGFTIIELLIYMGILTVVLGALTSVYGAVLDSGLENRAVSATQQNGRYITNRLTYDIQRASSITSPSLGSSDSTLQLMINGSLVTYQLNANGSLTITDSIGTDMVSAYDVSISALIFTRGGKTNGRNAIGVHYVVTGKDTPKKGAETGSFDVTIGTR